MTRETCQQRRFDPELKGADIQEARRRLFIRWDNIPFEFDWGLPPAARGRTVGDPGATGAGGGGGVQQLAAHICEPYASKRIFIS